MIETGALTPIERRKLTDRELEIWNAIFGEEPRVPMREVARRLGVHEGTVNRRYGQIRKKLGRAEEKAAGLHLTEADHPEKAAEAMAELASPLANSIKEIALEVGVPYKAAMCLAQRMDGRYLPLKRALGEVTKHELSDLCADRAYAMFASLDDETIADMGGYQRAIAGCALTDKHLLLEGQPTEILSVKELRTLDELMGLIVVEMRRRGLEHAGDPESGRVLLTERVHADGIMDRGRLDTAARVANARGVDLGVGIP